MRNLILMTEGNRSRDHVHLKFEDTKWNTRVQEPMKHAKRLEILNYVVSVNLAIDQMQSANEVRFHNRLVGAKSSVS